MANEFFQPGSVPANNAPGSSAIIRGEFAAVAAAFDKLPVMAGNANEIVVVNPSGTALTSAGVSFLDFATVSALAAVSAQVALKADANNAVLTGAPTASTPPTSDNSPRIATTQFVNDVVTALGGAVPSGDTPLVNGSATPGVSLQVSRSDHVHPTDSSRAPAAAATAVGTSFTPVGGISATNVQAALAELDSEKIGLNSPAFTGNPTAPTPATSDNDTSIATTAFVQALLAQQPAGTSVSSATPLMNGVASAGTGVDASRYDHIHPSDTSRASLTGAETLTNKTFALGSNTVTGTLAQFNAAVTDADLASLAGVETLTNKTFNLTSNTLSGTLAQFNTACSNADFASLSGVETLTNKTISAATNTITTAASGNLLATELNAALAELQSDVDTRQVGDATLTALAGVTVAANQLIYATGADAFAVTGLTAAGRALLDDADAPAQRVTLGLGTAATLTAGTGAGQVPTADQIPALSGGAAVLGAFRNLQASANGTTASVSVAADELVVENASNAYQTLRAVSLTINTAASGANGLDTGTLAASTWYALWVIWNGTTVAGLISTSATTPTMPSGYTHKARVGWIRTDASGNKYPLSFKQYGRRVQYWVLAGSNVPLPVIAASGAAGNISTPTWVSVALGNFVPPNTAVLLGAISSGGAALAAMVAPNNSYGAVTSSTNPPPVTNNSAGIGGVVPFSMIIESSSVYWASGNGSAALVITGWEDS